MDFEIPELDDIFSSNSEAEENGVWTEMTNTMAFKIRAFGAKKVIDLQEELNKPYAVLKRAGGKIPEDKAEDIGLKVLAGGVIADWRGLKNKDGEEIPYSAEAAYSLLKKHSRFANFVIGVATDAQQFRIEAREDGAGNS